MSTVSQIISQAPAQVMPARQPGSNPLMGSRQNDGYQSFGGSLVRNTLIGAGMGGVVGGMTGMLPVGLAAGAAVGAGSALIRQPRVANAMGDGMKASLAGASGGAVVGAFTPMGPLGGAIVGGLGGFLTGTASGLLKKHAGGKWSIEGQTTVWGRVSRGAMLGAIGGGAVGLGAGAMFGAIGLPAGPIIGAVIGAIGGGIHGLMSGTVDASTGAKGARFFGGGGVKLPGLPNGSSPGQTPVQQWPCPLQQSA